jgi:hypothetical protein
MKSKTKEESAKEAPFNPQDVVSAAAFVIDHSDQYLINLAISFGFTKTQAKSALKFLRSMNYSNAECHRVFSRASSISQVLFRRRLIVFFYLMVVFIFLLILSMTFEDKIYVAWKGFEYLIQPAIGYVKTLLRK